MKHHRLPAVLGLSFLGILTAEAGLPTTIYVDSTKGGGLENGYSWSNAFLTVQDALENAFAGQTILVAAGTYYPDEGGSAVADDRNSSFVLVNGVDIHGGFPTDGSGGDDPSAADPATYPTILSGDLTQDDGAGDPSGTNAYQVVTGDSADGTLSGFTIRNGLADGPNGSNRRGPALTMSGGTLTVLNCVIENHRSNNHGGGIFLNSSTSTLVNCLISGNAANGNGGGVWANGTIELTNCTVTGNWATASGAGVTSNGDVTFNNCVIWNNEGNGQTDQPGSSALYPNEVTLRHCLIHGRDLSAEGTGNFDGSDRFNDPLFVQPITASSTPSAAGDFHLGNTSLGIDSGLNSENPRSEDLDGNTRVQSGTIDLGCYEGGVAIPYASPLRDELDYPASQPDVQPGAYDLSSVFTDPGLGGLSYQLVSNSHPAFLTSVNVQPGGSVDLQFAPAAFGVSNLVFTADDGVSSARFELTVRRRLGTIHVDASAAPGGDGTSWPTAFKHLQDALAVAVEKDALWIADGTYLPDLGGSAIADDPASTFIVADGISLYGGFAGGELSLGARNPDLNRSILSGDIDENDTLTNGVLAAPWSDQVGTNARQVVTLVAAAFEDPAVLPELDGLIITGGVATGDAGSEPRGGGLYVDFYDRHVEFLIQNCEFTGNVSTLLGGGIYARTQLSILDCGFFNNLTFESGGGAYIDGFSLVEDCVFEGNYVGQPIEHAPESPQNVYRGGGGLWIGNMADVRRCRFAGNQSQFSGGGLFYDARGTLDSCLISGNRGFSYGGGVLVTSTDADFVNTTIAGNRIAFDGGGLSSIGEGFELRLTNSLVWGNHADQPANAGGHSVHRFGFATPLTWKHSLAQFLDLTLEDSSNFDGAGFVVNPLFREPIDPQQSPQLGGDYGLTTASPVIGGGDNAASTTATDLTSNPRIQNTTIDLGAVEGGSGSYNHYAAWIAQFYPGETDPAIIGMDADPNGDGVTNLTAYVTGTSASSFDPRVNGQIDASGVSFRSLRGSPLFGVEYEASTDLINWLFPTAIDPTITFTTNPGAYGVDFAGFGIDQVRFDWGDLPKVFIRQDSTFGGP